MKPAFLFSLEIALRLRIVSQFLQKEGYLAASTVMPAPTPPPSSYTLHTSVRQKKEG